MKIPADLRYAKTHEWAKREGEEIVVGITAHAQEELRDVVFVELPSPGRAVKAGEPVAVVESVKAAFDIYAPVSGTISRTNDALAKTPALINQDCYGAGWMFALRAARADDYDGLLSSSAYQEQMTASRQ
ncbi:MAG TPA: glycine cleavage system protein GcvH [bacterium]